MKKFLLLAALSVMFALSANASDTILTKRASVVLISTVYDSIQFPAGANLTNRKINELLATGSTMDTVYSHWVMTRAFPIRADDVYMVRTFALSGDKREVMLVKERVIIVDAGWWIIVMGLLYGFLAIMGLVFYLDAGTKKNDKVFTYAFLVLSSLGIFANIAWIQYGQADWKIEQAPLYALFFQTVLALAFFAFRARMLPFVLAMITAGLWHCFLSPFLGSAAHTGDYSLTWAYPVAYVVFSAFIVIMIERKLWLAKRKQRK